MSNSDNIDNQEAVKLEALLPVAGCNGWPTSEAVTAELRRLAPSRYGSMKMMRYTPGSGPPRSAAEIAAHMIAADETAVLMSTTGSYATHEEAMARLAPYVEDPDYTVEVRPIERGPKTGQWLGTATHKDSVI